MLQKLEVDEDVFKCFAFHVGLLGFKMLPMSFLTSMKRTAKGVYINEEDVKRLKLKTIVNDPDVERIRRAHRNDLENIILFLILAFVYCFTLPTLSTATMMFRTFTFARYFHTFVYVIWIVPQPARFIAFITGHACNFYMVYKILQHFSH